jgi:hypothetical protein
MLSPVELHGNDAVSTCKAMREENHQEHQGQLRLVQCYEFVSGFGKQHKQLFFRIEFNNMKDDINDWSRRRCLLQYVFGDANKQPPRLCNGKWIRD